MPYGREKLNSKK